MATFYHCKECGDEFLDMDNMDEDFLFCRRCGYGYECGICGDYFKPTVHETIDGVIFEGQTDYCPPCYARECVTKVKNGA